MFYARSNLLSYKLQTRGAIATLCGQDKSRADKILQVYQPAHSQQEAGPETQLPDVGF